MPHTTPSEAPARPARPPAARPAPALAINLAALLLLLSLVVVANKIQKLGAFAGGYQPRDLLAVLGLDFALLLQRQSFVLSSMTIRAPEPRRWKELPGRQGCPNLIGKSF